MNYNCIVLVINSRGVILDRKVLLNASNDEFSQGMATLKAKYPHEFITFLTEQEIDDYSRLFSQKRGG
jgi:hypothetical protein